MYHPTEMTNAATPTSWFYYLYTHTPLNQSQHDFTSKLEISILLDSGASVSFQTIPPMLPLQNFLILNKRIHLTNTTIEDDSRQFIIPFVVADIKYNILGTPFFEEYTQNINTQDILYNLNINLKTPKLYKINISLIQRLPKFLVHLEN